MSDSLLAIYKGRKKGNPDFQSFPDFENDMADPGKRQILYDDLRGKNPGMPGFEVFSRDMGFEADGDIVKRGKPAVGQDVPPMRMADGEPENRRGFWDSQVGDVLKRVGVENNAFSNMALKEKEKGFWDTYGGDFIERTGAGGADFSGSLYSLADKAYGLTLRPWVGLVVNDDGSDTLLKKWADEGYKTANELRGRSTRNGGKDYAELWKEGDYSGAIGDCFLQASESIVPGVLETMGGVGLFSRGARMVQAGNLAKKGLFRTLTQGAFTEEKANLIGAGIEGASAGVKKYDELDRMPETKDMPEFSKIVNATSTFVLEAASGFLEDKLTGKWLNRLYSNVGPEQAEKVVKKGLKDFAFGTCKKAGVFVPPFAAGMLGMVTQLTENITDFCTGATKEWKPMEGCLDALVYGSTLAVPKALSKTAKVKYNEIKADSKRRTQKGAQQSALPDTYSNEFQERISKLSPEERKSMMWELSGDMGRPLVQENKMIDFMNKVRDYRGVELPQERIREDLSGLFAEVANKKTGEIVTGRDGNGNFGYVVDESGEGCLVLFDNGKEKFIPMKDLQDVKRQGLDEHVNEYMAHKGLAGEAGLNPNVAAGVLPAPGGEVVPAGVQALPETVPQGGNKVESGVQAESGGSKVPGEGVKADGVKSGAEEIPRTKEGRPDYNRMFETDPELFAREWEKRSSPERARARLKRLSEDFGKRIEALQQQAENETDLNRVADMEDEIAGLVKQKERLEGVVSDRYAAPVPEPVVKGPAVEHVPEDKAGDVTEPRRENAEALPIPEPVPEFRSKESGEGGLVDTYIGKVRTGENQPAKMFLKKKSGELELIKPTLAEPDMIMRKNRGTGNTEQNGSYWFIKSFTRDGEKITYYVSVTAGKEGMELGLSNYVVNKKAFEKRLGRGKMVYVREQPDAAGGR